MGPIPGRLPGGLASATQGIDPNICRADVDASNGWLAPTAVEIPRGKAGQ